MAFNFWAGNLRQSFTYIAQATPSRSGHTIKNPPHPPLAARSRPSISQTECIEVSGAREHNLQNIDVSIPKRQITVVAGVSGSGKSSLVFDTVAIEAQRKLHELLPVFVQGFLPSKPRPAVDNIENLPGVLIVDQQRLSGGARSTLGTITDISPILRLLFSRVGEPHIGYADAFSFNMPSGMCPGCDGLGTITDIDLSSFLDSSRSLNEGALLASTFAVGTHHWNLLVASEKIDPDKPIEHFSDAELHELLYVTDGSIEYTVQGHTYKATYEGAVAKFRRLYLETDVEQLGSRSRKLVEDFTTSVLCGECNGARLSSQALSSRINGYNIAELSAMEITDLLGVLATLDQPEAQSAVATLTQRAQHLVDLGLGYLSLDRATSTLSGGESQRVKIVRHVTSSLNDLLYIFDEPSIGLHARDVHRLTDLLRSLRDKGNTVLVVEHDRDVIAAADHIIEIGPRAGIGGGQVQFSGHPNDLHPVANLTGHVLHQQATLKPELRQPREWLTVRNATNHNLRGLDVNFPQGVLTAVTGVAGSGKSSLMHGAFAEQHPGAVIVDQSALHSNRRSTIATYIGVGDPIRKAFAKANGVSQALFSANSKGACPNCDGLGTIQIDLAYLEELVATCEACDGQRFAPEVLAHRMNGKSIADVLNLTVAEATEFFTGRGKIASSLQAVRDVGLGYLRLGQSVTSLSGGERQRVKLASHLHHSGKIVVLDEPTTGLHLSDVTHLFDTFDRLVNSHGATVIVIEHNLDVIAYADWVIDLGPEGGKDGGQLVFSGTPHDLLQEKKSHTATHLRKVVANEN